MSQKCFKFWIKQNKKKKGVRFGRPKISTPSNTNEILDQYINHEITNIKTAKLIEVSRGTFFRLVKERRNQIKQKQSL